MQMQPSGTDGAQCAASCVCVCVIVIVCMCAAPAEANSCDLDKVLARERGVRARDGADKK